MRARTFWTSGSGGGFPLLSFDTNERSATAFSPAEEPRVPVMVR